MTDTRRTCKWCGVYIGPIPEHECSAFRVEPPLPPARTFADPPNDALKRYRSRK